MLKTLNKKILDIMKGFCKFWLKALGWKAEGGVAPENKCIIIGAPHTSAWDFIISWLFYTSVGGKASALVKKEFFFWWKVSKFLHTASFVNARKVDVSEFQIKIRLFFDSDAVNRYSNFSRK